MRRVAILAVALAVAAFVAMGQAPPDGSQDVWRVEDVFVIGKPIDPVIFGAVTAMAFGASGELAVLDALSSEVVVLAAEDGEVIRRFGRKGQGPGELNRPTLIAVAESGEVTVYDRVADRFSRFGPDGQILETRTIRPWGRFVGMAAMKVGLVMQISPRSLRPTPPVSGPIPRHMVIPPQGPPQLTLVADGSPRRTVWEWEEIEPKTRAARGEPSLLFEVSSPRWSPLPGSRVVVAQTDRYELSVLDLDGNLLQVIRRSVEPLPLTAEFKEFILAAQANVEGSPEILFPEFYPLISGLLPGPEGTILVWRTGPEGLMWEVLSLDGEVLAVLDAPADFRPMAARDGLVAGAQPTRDLETAVRVVRIERVARSQ